MTVEQFTAILKFVHREDAIEPFVQAFQKNQSFWSEIEGPVFADQSNSVTALSIAFAWRTTKQGFDYWCKISEQLNEFESRLRP